MDFIMENVRRVREQMAEAATRAGRDPAQIRLCAATKLNDAARIQAAVAAGVDCCGENRVQELLQKLPQHAYDGAPVHFIGHLQKNKAKQIVGQVALIQSVGSIELLALLNRLAASMGIVQKILLEVNIGKEPQKSGFLPEQIADIIAQMEQFPALFLHGLMAIPPVSTMPGGNRRYFAEMHQLFVDISAKTYDNVSMDCLSMGMSADFSDAIAEGSTMVRVGTAIFGPRNYTKN